MTANPPAEVPQELEFTPEGETSAKPAAESSTQGGSEPADERLASGAEAEAEPGGEAESDALDSQAKAGVAAEPSASATETGDTAAAGEDGAGVPEESVPTAEGAEERTAGEPVTATAPDESREAEDEKRAD